MGAAPETPDALRSGTVQLKDGRIVMVRPATPNDAQGMMENINAVGAEIDWIITEGVGSDVEREREWIAQYDGAGSVLYVAEADGRIVGQADVAAGRWPKETHVGTIGVAIQAGWRDAGLGRAMMERVLEWMRDRQFRKACLSVFSTNARAIALYRKLGFEVEGVRKRQFRVRDAWVDEVLMAKWLE